LNSLNWSSTAPGIKYQGSGKLQSALSFFNFFTKLGKLLIIPLILIFTGFMIYALVKLWPNLKHARFGIKDRLRNLLEQPGCADAIRQTGCIGCAFKIAAPHSGQEK
jgi:hypothetical protein